MPIVHGVPPSPFVRKVRVALLEKGIEHEVVPVPPFNQPPEFMAMSPLGKIPVYQDGDFTVPDSSVIIAYLERVHPKPALHPEDAQEYARALFLEEYADTKLAQTLGTVFFQRVVQGIFFKKDADEALVARTIEQDFPPVLDYLEHTLGEREYAAGAALSVADIALATQFQNLRHAREDVDAERWPGVAAFVERMLSRPSFKTCVAEERKLLAPRSR